MKKSAPVRKAKLTSGNITVSDLNVRGRNPKADARLLQITNAAATLFFEKGYVQTTTRDIGKACGISPGHLYYYINSKDDIPAMFAEIHKSDIDKWEKQIRKDMKTMPPEELLKKAVLEHVHLVHLRRKMVVFWYHASLHLSDEQNAGIIGVETRVTNLYKDIVELGIERGQFRVSDPFLTACNIHMMCVLWALKRWLIKDTRSIDQYAGVCVELVIPMVRGNTSPRR
ncbi:MAG: TetR/AcrR family transcriptional regulator [Chloroflexi bacterium]|nr:TetR/AcrR family transcriptional regulator [Chloroflexota bacterium]